MKEFLTQVGLIPIKGKSKTTLYAISNPDGSPRWIWNADNPSPDFLRFYTVNNFRSWALSVLFRTLFLLGFQKLVFKRSSIEVLKDHTHPLYPYIKGNFALFTGTEGPNRKLLLYSGGRFIKVAINNKSEKLIENENAILLQLKDGEYVEFPLHKSPKEGVLAMADLGSETTNSGTFTTLHAKAILEIQSQYPSIRTVFKNSKSFEKVKFYLQDNTNVSSHLIPQFLKEKLKELAMDLEGTDITLHFAHGDFTPWNCMMGKEKLKVFDLELASDQMPFGFDAFHFVMQQGVLVDRISYKSIKPKLLAAYKLIAQGGNDALADEFETYFKAYLLINCSYYLNLYGQQENWHLQIDWLLNTWNDAISDMLVKIDQSRSILIGDVFDFIQNKPYATVKLPDIDPRKLNLNSDIDFLIDRSTALRLSYWLSDHSLVHKLNTKLNSNMLSLLVILNDGSLLALDLIWQVRRKQLEFLNVEKAIQQAKINEFKIKTLNKEDLKTYLIGFYGLNQAAIPSQYNHYFSNHKTLNFLSQSIRQQVLEYPQNKGWRGFKNHLKYIMDTIKAPFQKKGLILTFSGVDGAGKSTVIDHTKVELEKKLRRKVVVIRHRPSIFPILSALTYGKEKAEKRAANSLPRKGKNKSIISSLLRFAYYYTDYLIGQFHVYLRYKSLGDIVLYDRYYFDFINDSLRSNIHLPKWLTKAGYRLLLKPNLNFFLYADAPVILSRKKELDISAINQLTQEYLQLFQELDNKQSDSYFTIENLKLEKTLAFITTKAQEKLL
ncbi:MAG: hypothetical protein ACXIUQ_13415 [Cecembia sp.]